MKFEQFRDLYEMFISQVFNLLDNKKPEAIGGKLEAMRETVEDFVDLVKYAESQRANVPVERRQSFDAYCRGNIDDAESRVGGRDLRSVEGTLLARAINQHKKSADDLIMAVVDGGFKEGWEDEQFDAEVDVLVQINNKCQPLLNEYERIWDEVDADIDEFETVMGDLFEEFYQTASDVYGLPF